MDYESQKQAFAQKAMDGKTSAFSKTFNTKDYLSLQSFQEKKPANILAIEKFLFCLDKVGLLQSII
jgi:hypothetical protein